MLVEDKLLDESLNKEVDSELDTTSFLDIKKLQDEGDNIEKKNTASKKRKATKANNDSNNKKSQAKNKAPNLTKRYIEIGDRLNKRLNTFVNQSSEAKRLYNEFDNGSRKFLRMSRIENGSYDMTWVKKVEEIIPTIDEIMKNPRIDTQTVTNIVPVELAKKTNGESIRHLASHTQFVKEVNEKGEVVPSKILETRSDDFYQTYENRFVATLVRRLVIFVEKRYDYITKYSSLKDYDVMYLKSNQKIDGLNVTIETKIVVSRDSGVDKEGASELSNFVQRVQLIRKYVKYFMSTEFMKIFKNEKDVRAPILQTNVIRKNPRYRKCYEFYRFMERYDKVGVGFSIDEDFRDLDKKTMDRLTNLNLATFLAASVRAPKEVVNSKSVKREPKILKTVDDDIYIFTPLGGTPTYIRVDEEYLKWSEGIVKTYDENDDSSKEVFDFDNYSPRQIAMIQKKRREQLLKRKAREEREFEKEQRRRLIELQKEEARRKEEERRRLEEEERARLEAARQYVKRNAQDGTNVEPLKEELPPVAQPVEEAKPLIDGTKKDTVEAIPTNNGPVQEAQQPEPVQVPESQEAVKDDSIETIYVDDLEADNVTQEHPQETIHQEEATLVEETLVVPIETTPEEQPEETHEEKLKKKVRFIIKYHGRK